MRGAYVMTFVVGMALASVGCAISHQRAGATVGDAGTTDGAVVHADASTNDGGASDAGVRRDGGGGPGGPRCGPNRCRVGEICCDEACGVCTFADECVAIECPGS